MGVGGTEDLHHPGQCQIGTGAHVQGRGSQRGSYSVEDEQFLEWLAEEDRESNGIQCPSMASMRLCRVDIHTTLHDAIRVTIKQCITQSKLERFSHVC